MKPKLSKKENLIRRIGSGLVALAIGLYLGLYLIPNGMLDFAIAMPVMVAASAIGAAIFYLTIKKSASWFWGAQGVFAVLAVAGGFAAAHLLADRHESLLTCQVCGYKSLSVEEAQCPVCGVRVSMAEASSNGYPDVQSLVMESQMMFFAPDSLGQSVDFLQGASLSSPYRKDSAWKPLITEEDIRFMMQVRDSLKSRPSAN